MDASALLAQALRQKVAFVPGTSFFPKGGGANTLRLNFSYCTPAVIEEGVRRLGAVICDNIGKEVRR
jgi:2-aminoadipate transaminase